MRRRRRLPPAVLAALFGSRSALLPPGAPAIYYDERNIDGAGNSTLVDGATIARWVNLGSLGSTGDAVQPLLPSRPVYREALGPGGGPAVVFTVGQSMVVSAAVTFSQPAQIAFVAALNPANSTRVAIRNGGATVFSGIVSNAWTLRSGGALSSGRVGVAGAWESFVGTANSLTSSINVSGSIATGDAGATGWSNIALHGGGDGGSFGTILFYAAPVEDEAVAAYFEARYGAFPQ